MTKQHYEVEPLMTIQDVAKYFEVSIHTVRAWIFAKEIQVYKLPNKEGIINKYSKVWLTRAACMQRAADVYELGESSGGRTPTIRRG